MVCLAFRPQTGQQHLLGRETFLTPVKWDTNAWPVVNGNGTIDINMDVPTLPLKPVKAGPYTTDFTEKRLGLEWNYLRNPCASNYSLTENPGYLRLKTSLVKLDDIDSPTFIGRRQEHVSFTATTSVNLFEAQDGDESGLTVFMNNKSYYDFFLKQTPNGKCSVVLRYRLGELMHTAAEIIIPKGKVYLQVAGDADFHSFAYSTDGSSFQQLGRMDARYISTETAGGFTGIYLGLFLTSRNAQSKAFAAFDNFAYLPYK